MVWWESIDSIAESLSTSTELESVNLVVTIILAGATVALAGFLGWQVFIQNRQTKLAYLPSIIPRQTNDGTNFEFVTIENIGNGAAKNVRMTVRNLRTNQTLSFNPLGMNSQQSIPIPLNLRMRGLINDEIELNIEYEDVSDRFYSSTKRYRVRELF